MLVQAVLFLRDGVGDLGRRGGQLGLAISQFENFGSSSTHLEIGPESFGIVV